MNAFAAAEQSGKTDALEQELVALAIQQNKSPSADATVIPATFLKVTVTV